MSDSKTNGTGDGRRPEQPLFQISPEVDRTTSARARRRARYEMKKLRTWALGPVKWAAYQTGQTRLVPPPDRMYIESTNLCNLDCVMCPTGLKQISRPKGYMDFDLFKAIVDEMAPHVKATTLHIWGEPLLHPRIYDMIAYCRRHGLHSEISTNATLLDEESSRKIVDGGLGAIYLCLDGATPETYEKVRRRGDFEEARDKILVGKQAKSLERTQKEIKETAYHEAGHALMHILQPEHAMPLHKVTVLARGGALGIAWGLPETDLDMSLETKESALANIRIALGGRAAEELVFGLQSSGASNDFEQATNTAVRRPHPTMPRCLRRSTPGRSGWSAITL